jgi:hypothetical protein
MSVVAFLVFACALVLAVAAIWYFWGIDPLVLALVVILTLCSPFDDRRFDRDTWLAFHGNSDADDPRGMMARDLQRRLLLGQDTRERVLELLGPPDHGKRADMLSYNLGMWSGFRMDYDSLDIYFDDQGRVAEVLIVQH